jgi:hypothetical protein
MRAAHAARYKTPFLSCPSDESGHVCTYLTFPNADQSLDDVTAEQARAAVRARPPAPDSLKVDGKRGAEATKEEMRDRDSRKPDEEKKRKEARGSTRRPAEQASPPPSPARVKETQEGTVAKPRTTDARAQDVPPPEKVEVKDRAVPEGSGEAAKPQGKPEDEAPAQGREASEAAGAGAGAGADHGERERQERVERLRTSMEKIEAKLVCATTVVGPFLVSGGCRVPDICWLWAVIDGHVAWLCRRALRNGCAIMCTGQRGCYSICELLRTACHSTQLMCGCGQYK